MRLIVFHNRKIEKTNRKIEISHRGDSTLWYYNKHRYLNVAFPPRLRLHITWPRMNSGSPNVKIQYWRRLNITHVSCLYGDINFQRIPSSSSWAMVTHHSRDTCLLHPSTLCIDAIIQPPATDLVPMYVNFGVAISSNAGDIGDRPVGRFTC